MLEYLSKKGYNKTEATLRREAAQHDPDGKPVIEKVQDRGGDRFMAAYSELEFRDTGGVELY